MTEPEKFDLKFEEFIEACRLCCRKSKNLIPMYHKIEGNNIWMDDNDLSTSETDSIPAMLLNIGLIATVNDGLPETLCSDCYTKLLNCIQFRQQCNSSTVYLQDILAKHNERVQIKTESAEDDARNLEFFLEIDNVDHDGMDTKVGEFTNGRVEALEITIQNENVDTNKRKRGRPKTFEYDSPSVKRCRSTKSNKTCKSSNQTKKKSERKDICLICGKVIYNNMKGHQATHDKSETFQCDICGFETNVKLYLRNHMKRVHIAQRQYPCPHCHLVLMHAVTLKRHITIHTGEKNFVCEKCGKSYRQRDTLKEHRKRHLPPTIQCSFCDKLFYSKNELKSHIGTHTGIKTFKCDLCSAAFAASSSLAAHRRQHKKDNVLPSCKICKKKFSDRLVYNMHMMDHKRMDQSIAYSEKQ